MCIPSHEGERAAKSVLVRSVLSAAMAGKTRGLRQSELNRSRARMVTDCHELQLEHRMESLIQGV